jgi:hypothetical protein
MHYYTVYDPATGEIKYSGRNTNASDIPVVGPGRGVVSGKWQPDKQNYHVLNGKVVKKPHGG